MLPHAPRPHFFKTALPHRQHKHTNTNPFKQPVMYSQCIPHTSLKKVTHTHHSARGESLNSGSPLCQVDTSSEGSWCAACQRRYEDTRENGRAKKWRQSLTASTSLPPLWCDGFVMWRSCQISGPVTALSACLLGLTESVMELRLNKRVITFPVLNHTTLSYVGRREEKASVLRAERSRGGERVTLQPSSKKV